MPANATPYDILGGLSVQVWAPILGVVILLLAFLVQKYRLHKTGIAFLLVCMTITAAVLVLRRVLSPAISAGEYIAWEFGAGVLGMLIGFWLASSPEQDRRVRGSSHGGIAPDNDDQKGYGSGNWLIGYRAPKPETGDALTVYPESPMDE